MSENKTISELFSGKSQEEIREILRTLRDHDGEIIEILKKEIEGLELEKGTGGREDAPAIKETESVSVEETSSSVSPEMYKNYLHEKESFRENEVPVEPTAEEICNSVEAISAPITTEDELCEKLVPSEESKAEVLEENRNDFKYEEKIEEVSEDISDEVSSENTSSSVKTLGKPARTMEELYDMMIASSIKENPNESENIAEEKTSETQKEESKVLSEDDEKLNINFSDGRKETATVAETAKREEPVKKSYAVEKEKTKEVVKNKSGNGFKIFCISLLTSLLTMGSVGGFLYYKYGDSIKEALNAKQTVVYQTVEKETAPTDNKDTTTNQITIKEVNLADSVEKVIGSVVEINTEQMGYSFFGGTYTARGGGSGVIISEDGYILTNAHVVEGTTSVSVSLEDKDYEAQVIGSDTKTDIAVLKIESDTKFIPVTIGDSDKLRAGEPVFVIGDALGTLEGTVTHGIVSNPARKVSGNTTSGYTDLIQTDAAINSGNSGGGMFNQDGELVGIVNSKDTGTSSSGAIIEGLGFAIPVNKAMEVAEQLMESGVVNRPVLGVTVSEVKGYEGYEDGVYIVAVSNGSAAEKAGVKVEDRVIEFNNTKITTVDELLSEVQKAQPNEKVEMIVVRNGKEITLDVELGSEIPFSNQESERNKLE